ncbi:hypothetical protein [Yoonia vestfoldensis]|jgi:hypothetical protein|uniref:Uncharacterized protein n=1 Tax=Yoonia vestfoldensis TaxID=245188 RepID=A0A1Y0EFE6_9RHOB|nr:hypothetical protein [Yoonia vestfoldensis]ARU02148.1 hypothetical protein LOKVESSMR4R_02857 [Yoonia vestfoldensis]
MLNIPANDHGALYVLAATATDAPTIAAILGPVTLNTDFVDLISPDQRATVPLPELIRQGYDMALTAEQEVLLQQAQGTILLVMSRAFDGQAQQIDLPAGTVLVTVLRETPVIAASEKLTSPSGAGALPGPPAKPRKSDARMSGMVATAALLIMFALVGLVVWVGG